MKSFMVEGEQRLFVRETVKVNKDTLFDPVLTKTFTLNSPPAAQKEQFVYFDKPEDADKAIVIGSKIGANVLRVFHLKEGELLKVVRVPKPSKEGYSTTPFSDKDLQPIYEYQGQLRHDRTLVTTIRLKMQATVKRVMPGTPANNATIDIGQLEWEFEGPAYFPDIVPEIKLPDEDELDLQCAEVVTQHIQFDATKPPDRLFIEAFASCKITEVNATDYKVTLVVDQLNLIKVLDASDKPGYSFEWRLLAQRSSDQKLVSISYQPTQKGDKYYDSDLTKRDELIHPAWCQSLLVDLVGEEDGSVLKGRAYPQGVPGTLTLEGTATYFASPADAYATIVSSDDLITRTGYFKIGLSPKPFPAMKFDVEWLTCPWLDNANKECLPLVAEVSNLEKQDADNFLFTYRTRDRGTGAILAISNASEQFKPAASTHPMRQLRSLRFGELVFAYGTVATKDNSGTPLFHLSEYESEPGQPAELSAVVRGVVEYQERTLPEIIETKRKKALLTTPQQVVLNLWYEAEETPPIRDCVTLVTPGLAARTVSQYALPMIGTAQDPLNTLASDLIARWGGWTLTTPLPGETDRPYEPTTVDAAFTVDCHRDNSGISLMPVEAIGDWRLPPLRFGHKYEFCLRRVDLAGNHLYDEGRLPDDASLPSSAVNKLKPLLSENPMLATICSVIGGPAAAISAAGFINTATSTFARADLPSQVSLGFQSDQPFGIWEAPPPEQPDVKNLQVAVFQRENVLVYFSDVLDRGCAMEGDACGYLLPPLAAVETVLMHGVLDSTDPLRIPEIIRCHECYLKNGVLGVDRHDALNYFGDPHAEKLRLDYVNSEYSSLPVHNKGDTIIETPFYRKWPCPQSIMLKIQGGARERDCLTTEQLAGTGKMVKEPGNDCVTISAELAPGTVGYAALLPTTRNNHYPEHQRLKMIHAINGAWMRPVWTRLEEKEPIAGADSSHEITGTFRIDTASTGSYFISGFWNECWDEALPLGWQEATIQVDAPRGRIEKVTVIEPGYGYGSEAVAMIVQTQEPMELPELLPSLHHGKLMGVSVIRPGKGYDWRSLSIRIVRKDNTIVACPTLTPKWSPTQKLIGVKVEPMGEPFDLKTMMLRVDARPVAKDLAEYPLLHAELVDGKVKKVNVLRAGQGFDHTVMSVRIIRRPPLMQIAKAIVHRSTSGALKAEDIEIVEPGGYYTCPPLVIASDASGDGYGAKLLAELNGTGGVARVKILDGGAAYSDDVELRFYTHQWNAPERGIHNRFDSVEIDLSTKAGAPQYEPQPDAQGNPVKKSPDPEPFVQHFSDPLSRTVDYYITANGRFSHYLLDPVLQVDALSDEPVEKLVRTPVPRISRPLDLNLITSMKPLMPNVSHQLPAFEWTLLPGDGVTLHEPYRYFEKRETGQLLAIRRSKIRVYLQRPWHRTGSEFLGVVICPAILNSIQYEGNLQSKDHGVVNRAQDYYKYELNGTKPKVRMGELTGDVIPLPLRHLVSRWGFDPVWNTHGLPPFTLGHFPDALTEVEYSLVANENVQRLAALALHRVQYDPTKNRWYSDIGINLHDAGKPLPANPFVRLNLVTYQMHGKEGQRSSDIAIAEMFPLMGERTLEVNRLGKSQFEFMLSGGIEPTVQGDRPSPQRRVIIEVRSHRQGLPMEIVQSQLASETKPAEWSREFEMKLDANNVYTLKIDLPGEITRQLGTGQCVLTVREKEYFPTLSPQPGGFGDRTEHFLNRASAVRVPFSMSFSI
ncbi:MAG: hypothetical protein QM703_14190 [Gemmatales bacterium]